MSDQQEHAVDAAIVRKATEFGSIVLPPGSEVLDVETQRGINTYFRLTVRTDAAGAETLRVASGATTTPGPLYPPVPEVAAGPALAADPAVTTLQDNARNSSGQSVIRNVIIDQRDPAAVYIHLELFTT